MRRSKTFKEQIGPERECLRPFLAASKIAPRQLGIFYHIERDERERKGPRGNNTPAIRTTFPEECGVSDRGAL